MGISGHSRTRAPAPRPYTAPLFACLALLSALFVLLAVLAARTPYFPVDLAVARSVQAPDAAWLDTLATAVSWIGFPPQVDVIAALIAAALFLLKARRQALFAVAGAAGAAILWFIVAPLVHRPRPAPDLIRVDASIPYGSFPSGHVLNLTVLFGFLFFLAYTELPRSLARTAVLVTSVLVVGLIGLARIYSGEHWPSDILGGYLLGFDWLGIIIFTYSRLRRRQFRYSASSAYGSP